MSLLNCGKHMTQPTATEPGLRRSAALPVLFGGIIALGMAHYPMIVSGLRLMQMDDGDTRFNNYLLEHTYLWLCSAPQHRSLWNPPFFYPMPSVLALSDVMLSFGPLYWIWRILGVPPDTSFQLWMMACCVINYVMAFVLLWRFLRASLSAAVFGAVFFASASLRITQIGHQQLYCQGYVLLAVIALIKLFTVTPPKNASPRPVSPQSGACIALLGASVTLQLWGGFYNGYFILFCSAIAAIFSLLIPTYRQRLFEVFWRNRNAISATALVCGLLLAPLASHYLAAMKAVGPRSFDEVVSFAPRPFSWIYMGPLNLPYAWMASQSVPTLKYVFEQSLGIGFLSTAVIAFGLWSGRHRPLVLLLILVTALIIPLTTVYQYRYTCWYFVFETVPGASAIRSIGRLALMCLLPASIGLALFIDFWPAKKRWLALAIAALCIGEQLSVPMTYDKAAIRDRVAAIAARISPARKPFYYSTAQDLAPYQAQIDAMWASLATGVPTINGYSGAIPPGYGIYKNAGIATNWQRDDLRRQLAAWRTKWGLTPANVIWIGESDPIQPAP
jgi:hypothetical protein